MDRNDAPCPLHAELFEERGCHDLVCADESVRVEQRAANDGDEDDAEPAAKDLRAIPHNGPAGHGPEISDDLGDGDGVGGEVVLVLDHERVEVLRAVGHEVEAGHEEDEVDEEDVVFLEGNTAFGEEGAGDATVGFAHGFSLPVGGCFGQAEPEDDDEDGWAGAEPEEGAPAVGGGVYEAACEGGCEEVAECVALLQHAADQASGSLRTVLQSSRRCISIEATHRNAEQRTAWGWLARWLDSCVGEIRTCKELTVSIAEAGPQLENDEEDIVDDEGPLAAIAISCDTC